MTKPMTPQERAAAEQAYDVACAIRDEIGSCYLGSDRDGIGLPWDGDWVRMLAEHVLKHAQQTRRAALLEASKAVPTTWLDPLLQNIKVSPCPEIETLLRGVKDKITRLAQEG